MDHSIGLTSLSNHSQLNRTTTIDHQHLQQSHHDSQQQHNDPHSSSKCNNERGQHILNISNQSNNSNISQSNILCSNSETDFRNPNPGGLLLSNHNLAPNSMPVCEIDTSSIQTLMSRNRQQLQVKLLVRRPIAALIEQGILPPQRQSPSTYEQARKQERARTSDLLNAKITSRPDRQQLIATHILTDSNVSPALVARQQQLKRAQLADDLNERLSHRPGPLELIKGNILKAPSTNAAEAVRLGRVQFKPTSAGQPVKHPTPCFLHSRRPPSSPDSIDSTVHYHHHHHHLHHHAGHPHHPHHHSIQSPQQPRHVRPNNHYPLESQQLHSDYNVHHESQQLHSFESESSAPDIDELSGNASTISCACGINQYADLFDTSHLSPDHTLAMEESNEEDDEVEAEDEEDEEMLSNDKEGETEMQDDATVYNEIKTEMIDNHNMEDNPKRTHGVTTIEKDDQVRPEVVGLVAGSPGKLAAAVAQTAKRHNRRMAAQAKASLNSKSLNVKNKTIKFHEYKGPGNVARDQKPVSCSKSSVINGETAYELLLQQQQVYLQLELEAQQQQQKLHAIGAPKLIISKNSLPNQTICNLTSPPVSTEARNRIEPDTNDDTASTLISSRSRAGGGCGGSSGRGANQRTAQSQSPDQQPDQSDESINRWSSLSGSVGSSSGSASTTSTNVTTFLDEQQLQQMKVQDLKQQLKRHRLPVSGSKPLLVERLKKFMTNQNSTHSNGENDLSATSEEPNESIGLVARSATFSAGCSTSHLRLQPQIATARRQTLSHNDIQAPLCKQRRTSEPVLSFATLGSSGITPQSALPQTSQTSPQLTSVPQPSPIAAPLQLHLAPAPTQIVQLTSGSASAPSVLPETVQLVPTPVSLPGNGPFAFTNWTLQPTATFPQLVLYPTGSNTTALSLVAAGAWAPLQSICNAPTNTTNDSGITLTVPTNTSSSLTHANHINPISNPNHNAHNIQNFNQPIYSNSNNHNLIKNSCLTNLSALSNHNGTIDAQQSNTNHNVQLPTISMLVSPNHSLRISTESSSSGSSPSSSSTSCFNSSSSLFTSTGSAFTPSSSSSNIVCSSHNNLNNNSPTTVTSNATLTTISRRSSKSAKNSTSTRTTGSTSKNNRNTLSSAANHQWIASEPPVKSGSTRMSMIALELPATRDSISSPSASSPASLILTTVPSQGHANRLIDRPPPNYEEATRDQRRAIIPSHRMSNMPNMTTTTITSTPNATGSIVINQLHKPPRMTTTTGTLTLMNNGKNKPNRTGNCPDNVNQAKTAKIASVSLTNVNGQCTSREGCDVVGDSAVMHKNSPEITTSESSSCELDLDWLMDVCEPFDPVGDDARDVRSADREFNEFLQQLADSMSSKSEPNDSTSSAVPAVTWNRTCTTTTLP